MPLKKKNLLQIPRGTESISLEEALFHQRVTRKVEDLFLDHGYLPAHVPVFDFFDMYQPLLQGPAADRVYRLIDREGDLLMLRSDLTLFLARQMSLILTNADLPVRVYYADTILRHESREDISKNEFFQSGAELIGLEGTEGDLEILGLAMKVCRLFDIPDSVIHLGTRELLPPCLPGADRTSVNGFAEALARRSRDEVTETLTKHHSPAAAARLAELLFFIGPPAEFGRLLARVSKGGHPADIRQPLASLKHLLDNLGRTMDMSGVRIDLSEAGNQPYHTGMAFQAYIPGADSAVLSGGRYDSLLSSFGFPAPSVGFSVLQRKIEPFVRDRRKMEP